MADHDLETLQRALEQVRAELDASEKRFRQLADASFDAIFIVDAGRIVDANDVAARLYGHSRDELLGLQLIELVDDAARETVARHLAVPGNDVPVEVPHRKADESVFQAELRARSIPWRDSMAQIVVVRDVSERTVMAQQLAQLVRIDELTGINNRRWFTDLAQQELYRSQRYHAPLCVMVLDIDHFQRINDTSGRDAGDRTLRAMADTCAGIFRKSDLFGRVGGGKFAAALPMSTLKGALVIAEELRERLSEVCVIIEGGTLSFTVSIGVVELRDDDNGIEALLDRANEALDVAKNRGRNRVASA
jgi:diguanylate cyclase (GGDEF)-like protein/PAS domain S-box-containing protein